MNKIDNQTLIKFLQKVDQSFPIPLSEKVSLAEYSKKLLKYAKIYTIMEGEDIVSLVAGYNSNLTDNMAFISMAATIKEKQGLGYASRLFREFIGDCKVLNIKGAHFYCHPSNINAIRLYRKIGFVDYVIENEPRPGDVHLVYWIS